MFRPKLVCEKCGCCCLQLDHIEICKKDVRRWVDQNEGFVLQYCQGWNEDCWNMLFEHKQKLIEHLTKSLMECEMWFDPETRQQMFLCPFLRKRRSKNQFECMIHDSKPLMCQDYICGQKDMKGIVKRPFEENLRDYRKRRKQYLSFLKYIYPKEKRKKRRD
jgi:Fe-S-cluster containining protein